MTPELTGNREVGLASLPNASTNIEIENTKRLIHFVWFPHVDIPIVGPDGLRFRLGKGKNYYGMGQSGDDFGMPLGNRSTRTPFASSRPANSKPAETAEEYNQRAAGFLLRCDPIPVWNIDYLESRFNHGNFTDAEWKAGNTLNADVESEDVVIPAGVCAADFVQRYEVTHGARVLAPLVGMDGDEMETAFELVRLVQPHAYKLTNYRQEQEQGEVTDEETLLFDLSDRGPAEERIAAAKLDKVLKPKAHQLRQIMRNGVLASLFQARADWEDLLFQLGNTAKGHKGNKKRVSPYDRQVAWLLGEVPPANIAAQPTDGGLRESVRMLTDLVARGTTGNQIQVTPDELRALIDDAVEQRLSQNNKNVKPKDEKPK